jgi:hypothetical protein
MTTSQAGAAYHAMTLPAKNEIETFKPTSIPEPMKAGVNWMNQPQFSTAIAAFL